MNKDIFSFSNLGWGRKIYLALLWLGTLIFAGYGLTELLDGGDSDTSTAGYVGLFLILPGTLIWKHFAVVKRRYIQLVVVGLIDLVLFSVISAIILFILAYISKQERETTSATQAAAA